MKIVKKIKLKAGFDALTDHYKSINSLGEDIDEGDLVIFRLLGAKFEYSAVEFNPLFLLAESDVS